MTVAFLNQDREAALGGDLADKQMDVDLGLAIKDVEEDLEVAVLEEEEEDVAESG